MYFFIKVQNTRLHFVQLVSRCVFTDGTKRNTAKEVKFMNKLIKKGQSKRDSLELFGNSYGEPKTQLSKHTLRRMAVLNKVFMEYITDMMSTGEIEPEILQRDIEISHIKVTPDFKQLNVFWIDHSGKYSDTEELLKKCAFQLRYELSKLRVIGHVPPIQFVKCKGIHILKEVERKFKQLDLDESHVPSPYSDAIHHIVSAETVDSNTGIENDRNCETTKDFSVTIPVMQHNVFGLDHHRIMMKIKASLNKQKKTVKEPGSGSVVKVNTYNISNVLTNEEQKEQFAKFLKEKRKERRLRSKNMRSRESEMYNLLENVNDNEDYDIDGNYYGDDTYDGNDNGGNDDDNDFDEYYDEKLNKKR